MNSDRPSPWLALMIGNSRLHWAIFVEDRLQFAWDTPYLSEQTIAHWIDSELDLRAIAPDILVPLLSTIQLDRSLELWLASVVPTQTSLWQAYFKTQLLKTQLLTLRQVPLQGTYPTLGIDRALALWGAIALWEAPVLVIDAGTALTLTAADRQSHCVGGAILPGLQLQMRSLSQHTAALPSVDLDFTNTNFTNTNFTNTNFTNTNFTNTNFTMPSRWATNTPDAIRSGVLYSLLATIQDFGETWLRQCPTSAIALTGGDGALLYEALQTRSLRWGDRFQLEPHLVLRGIAAIRNRAV